MNPGRFGHWLKSPLTFVGALVVLTAIMTYPLVSRAWDTIANYGDPLLNAWILAWDSHTLITDPLGLFNANIFHPYLNTLAYSEHLLGIALPAAPLFWATGTAIFVHNLAVLWSFILSGLGAYLLACDLTRSRYAGWIAGIAYAFAGYRFSEIGQLQNVTVQWLPFMFLYLARFFWNEARATWRTACLFGLFFLLQVLSNNYYAVYTVIAVGLYLILQLWRVWRAKSGRLSLKAWGRLGLTLVVVLLIFVAVFSPYLAARNSVGERSLQDQDGANLRDYVSVPETSLLAQLIPAMRRDLGDGKSYFPGFVILFLLGVAAVAWLLGRRNGSFSPSTRARGDALFYVCLLVVGFVLSLGPGLQLIPGGPTVLSPLPYTFLYEWVPGISGMRVPARLALLVIFATAILAAYGAAYIARRGNRGWLLILPLILIAEHFMVVSPGRPVEVGAQVPPVYRWLGGTPAQDVILELPATNSSWFWQDAASMERLATQQYFSTYHWHPSIMGYSGFYPPLFGESIDRALHFPSNEALSYLRGLGVRNVILHEGQFAPKEWEEVARRLPLFANQLSPLRSFGTDHVFALTGSGQKPQALELELQVPPVARPGKASVAYLGVTNPNAGSVAHPTQEKYTLAYEWRAPGSEPVRGVREGYLPFTNPEGKSYIPLPFPAPGEMSVPITAQLKLNAYGQTLTTTVAAAAAGVSDAGLPMPPDAGARHLLAADLNFGNRVRLTHVALDADAYRPGDGIALTLHWQKLTHDPVDNHVVFFRLEQDGQQAVASADMPLATPAAWELGETAAMQRLQRIPLDAPPGAYRLVLGVYDARAKEFVPVIGDDGSPQWETFQTTVTIR